MAEKKKKNYKTTKKAGKPASKATTPIEVGDKIIGKNNGAVGIVKDIKQDTVRGAIGTERLSSKYAIIEWIDAKKNTGKTTATSLDNLKKLEKEGGVKIKKSTEEKVAMPKTAPIKPVKTTKATVAKSLESKPAAAKKTPKPAPVKPATPKAPAAKAPAPKKDSAGKLIKHSDKDEMKIAGEKPIVINGANVKSNPKVLRKVAKSGGYTAWDAIRKSGKTFATKQEAEDYAAEVRKKTGKIVPIEPTDRQVTHTFKADEKAKR